MLGAGNESQRPRREACPPRAWQFRLRLLSQDLLACSPALLASPL